MAEVDSSEEGRLAADTAVADRAGSDRAACKGTLGEIAGSVAPEVKALLEE